MTDIPDVSLENATGVDLTEFMEVRWGSVRLLSVIVYTSIVLIGAIGNLWVAWKVGIVVLFSGGNPARRNVSIGGDNGDKSLGEVPRGILISLLVICISDLVVLSALSLLVDDLVHARWRFGLFICKMYYCAEVLNKFVVPCALVTISWCSYRAVAAPGATDRKASTMSSRVYAVQKPGSGCSSFCGFREGRTGVSPLLTGVNLFALVSLLTLIVSFLFQQLSQMTVAGYSSVRTYELGMNPMTGASIITYKCSFHPPEPFGRFFDIGVFIVGYLLTSVAYVYFYASVPLILRRRSSIANSTKMSAGAIQRIQRTVSALVVVYLACWTPYWIVFWLISLVEVQSWLVTVSLFAHSLPYVSCSAYPVILTAMNRGIQSAHTQIMRSKRRQLKTIKHSAPRWASLGRGAGGWPWSHDISRDPPSTDRPSSTQMFDAKTSITVLLNDHTDLVSSHIDPSSLDPDGLV